MSLCFISSLGTVISREWENIISFHRPESQSFVLSTQLCGEYFGDLPITGPESVISLYWAASILFFFKILLIYSWETHTQRERERQRHRQREKQAPCREPDMGLDPGSPGSRPGLKAALNHWATWASLRQLDLMNNTQVFKTVQKCILKFP